MGLVMPDTGLLIWMVITFLIVLMLLKKFAWKPILKMIKEREDSIDSALKSAERAKVSVDARCRESHEVSEYESPTGKDRGVYLE